MFATTPLARAAGRSLVIMLVASAALLASAGAADARSGKKPGRHKLAKPGTVVSAAPLKKRLWIPQTTRSAFVLKYVTTNAFEQRALSTGTLFLPKGKMPRGGWPVISWAHGSVGLGDGCAPSRVGSAFPELEQPYLATWMRQGYAIVATDYAALAAPMAYLDGLSEAHNVVDMVKAGRAYARARIFSLLGPNVFPAPLPGIVTANGAYFYASLRYVHPELGLDGVLTPAGRQVFGRAETDCVTQFANSLEGVNASDAFSGPVASLPGWKDTVSEYMALPESGFDRPSFIGQGSQDISTPAGGAAEYASVLQRNGEPVTFKTYDNDHLGAWIESQPDAIPFVRALLAQHSG
jgi:hypothetical protein